MAKGYFAEEGIEIQPLEMASGVKILEALGSDSIDIGYSAVVPFILANSKGLKLVAITGGPTEDKDHVEHAVLVRNNSPIKRPKDLKGKTIAIVAFKSIDELFLKEWLDKNGVDVQSVNFLEIPFPQMEPTLLAGEVDAIATIEPFVTAAHLNGKSKVLGYNYIDVQQVTEIGSYNVKQSWLDRNLAVATGFSRAMRKAAEYANAHPEEVKSLIMKYTGLKPDLVRNISIPLYTAYLSDERLAEIVTLTTKWRLINSPVDVKTLRLK
jgi:NitT/TauT family transport system substrate-binding protein